MKEIPHDHTCTCSRLWSCRNAQCLSTEVTWCRLGKESKLGACQNPTPEIRRVAYLEDYADKLREEAQVLKRDLEPDIARNVVKLEQIVRVRIKKIVSGLVVTQPLTSGRAEAPVDAA